MPVQFCLLAVAIRNRRIWQKHVTVKLRVVRYVPHNACYLQGHHSAKACSISGLAIGRGCDGLSNDSGGTEVFSRGAFGKDQRLWIQENAARVALQQWQLDDLKEIRIDR